MQRNALILFCAAHRLRSCSVQLLKWWCSDGDLSQLLVRAFKWKKSEQIEDSLIKWQLVERKAFHRNLLLFVSKGWHFCSKSDYFDSNLLRGDITLSLMVLVQTTDLNQSSPHPPAGALMVRSQDVPCEKLDVPLEASRKDSRLSKSEQVTSPDAIKKKKDKSVGVPLNFLGHSKLII